MPSHSNNDASEAWTDIDSHSPVPQRYFTDEISPPQNTRFYISDDDNIEAIDYKRHARLNENEKKENSSPIFIKTNLKNTG